MSKKKRKAIDWKSYGIVGLLALVLLIGAGNASGAFDLKAKLAEILLNRIDAVIEQNLAASIEYLDEEEIKLGGLVEVFRKIFPQGLIIGSSESQNIFLTDSSNTLYIGTSTDATFSINATTGRITMRNINFVTSSLNWNADFSAGDGNDFYVDTTNQRVGIGTSTPSYQLEVVNGDANTVLAITATSTNDAILRFNLGYQTAKWLIYVDNSDYDKLKISTTSDFDTMTIDAWGNVTIRGGLAMTTSTISGSLKVGSAGTTFTKLIATTTNVDFGAVEANGCESATTTIRIDGTAHTFGGNELVMIGIDDSLAATNTDITFMGYIASDDDVGIRMCNASTTATGDYSAVDLRIGIFDF